MRRIIRLIMPLIFLSGCSKNASLVKQQGVITEIETNKNEEIVSLTVLKEDGEKEKVEISDKEEKWVQGQEVIVAQEGNKITIDQYISEPNINETVEPERPISEIVEEVDKLESLNNEDIVKFNADELIESYFLDEEKIVNASAYMGNDGNDVTTVLVFETNDPEYSKELKNVFADIIEANEATFEGNDKALAIISNAYEYYDDNYAVLAIGDEVLIETVKNIFDGGTHE